MLSLETPPGRTDVNAVTANLDVEIARLRGNNKRLAAMVRATNERIADSKAFRLGDEKAA